MFDLKVIKGHAGAFVAANTVILATVECARGGQGHGVEGNALSGIQPDFELVGLRFE